MRISDWSSDVCSSDLRVSLFIEPDPLQLEAAAKLGAPVVELHTGAYCDAYLEAPAGERMRACLNRIRKAAALAGDLGLEFPAGHALTFDTVRPVAVISPIAQLNTGHFLISYTIYRCIDCATRRPPPLTQHDH